VDKFKALQAVCPLDDSARCAARVLLRPAGSRRLANGEGNQAGGGSVCHSQRAFPRCPQASGLTMKLIFFIARLYGNVGGHVTCHVLCHFICILCNAT
jgi:hypothetical protein